MRLVITALAIGPILLGMMAYQATGGNAVAGWVTFVLMATVAGFVLKATNLDR